MQLQEDEQKVQQIMSEEKASYFKIQLINTILGIEINEYPWYVYLGLVVIMQVILIVIDIYLLAILLPTFAPTILVLIFDIAWGNSIKKHFEKYIIFLVYSFFWSNHFYHIKGQIAMLVLSSISVVTSINTIALHGCKQYSMNTPYYNEIGFKSTKYMRFFIVFPLLLAQVIIDFTQTVQSTNSRLYALRMASSLIFITWQLGWISSFQNSVTYILQSINHIILGDEKKHSFPILLISIILNFGAIALSYILINDQRYNHLILAGCATVSSFIVFGFMYWSFENNKFNACRLFLSIFTQLIAVLLALLLISFVQYNKNLVTIFLAIDIGIYALLWLIIDLLNSRNHFGLLGCLENKDHIYAINRVILRLTTMLCIIFVSQQLYFWRKQIIIGWSAQTIAYFVIPILIYRSYKRSISQPRSVSLHLSILIAFIVRLTFDSKLFNSIPVSILIILLMPPYPSNFYLTLITPFITPPKALHKYQCLYRILYYLFTFIGLLIHMITLGSLQLTMIFGLPLFWPIIPNRTQKQQLRTKEESLYRKIVDNLNMKIFNYRNNGLYLLRIQKYIVLVQIKAECYGICQIIQFIGMEVQQVTSCHSREGETIDTLVEQTWGDNKVGCSLWPYSCVLWPISKQKVSIPMQNEIKLTGIIQSQQFVQLFKLTVLKSFIRQFSKITYTDAQLNQSELIYSQYNAIKKQHIEKLFPYEFAKECNLPINQPTISAVSNLKKKLPPIKKKEAILNDFLDLIEEQKDNSTHEIKVQQKQPSITNMKIQQLNYTTILTFFYYTVGKLNYVNLNQIYKMLKCQADALTQIAFSNKQAIICEALSAAFKISIGKFLEGDFDVTINDFNYYDKNEYFGVVESLQFSQALKNNKQDIWTLSYLKKQFSINRLAKSETTMYIFTVDECIVNSVWNNLRFELLFATNNDDQRYSIQTHPKLLRNLWIEGCEQPYGYAGYYSGDLLIF